MPLIRLWNFVSWRHVIKKKQNTRTISEHVDDRTGKQEMAKLSTLYVMNDNYESHQIAIMTCDHLTCNDFVCPN